MERKIDLTGNQESLPTYTAHLVPCKVRYTGPTTEFQDNLLMDSEHHRSLKKAEPEQQSNVSHVTYIRGRKIAGQEVLGSDQYATFLMNSSTDASGDSHMKPMAKVSNVINYERDGNEDRLQEELEKFNELLELTELIHS